MRKICVLIILLSLGVLSACGNSDKTGTDKESPRGIERYIIAKSGLRMRDKPDLTGKKLLLIPYGKSVRLLEETGEAVTISGVTGRWSKVVWRTTTGWVFGGFLGSSVADRAGKILPAGMLGTYLLKEKVELRSMPSRIHLENTIITKTRGGDVDSNEYCIVEDVKSRGKIHTVICSSRKPTDEEYRIFQLDKSAAGLKKIMVVEKGAGKILVGKELYQKR